MKYTAASAVILLTLAVPQILFAQSALRASRATPEPKLIRVFRVESADATALASIFEQLFRDDITVVTDRATNSLIVRGTTTSLAKVQDLFSLLDRLPPERSEATMPNDGASGLRASDADPLAYAGPVEIEDLRKEYQANEHGVRETAAKLLAARPTVDAKLQQKLRSQVAASFRIRQQLHQAELDVLQGRLQQSRATIAMRTRIEDEIIARRVEDLLNPDIQWDQPTAQSARPIDETRPTNLDRTPVDELAAYRGFLWESLKPLQHQRNELLSLIAEIEQSVVELESVDISADAEADEKERLERENAVIASKIAQLNDRLKSLRPELDSTERQITFLKRKLAEVPTAANAKDIALDATVTALGNGTVKISAGSDEGAGQGLRLRQTDRGEEDKLTPDTTDLSAPNTATFAETIVGKWIIVSCERRGEMFRTKAESADAATDTPGEKHADLNDQSEAQQMLLDYAVVHFQGDHVAFVSDSDELVAKWYCTIEDEADPRQISLVSGDKTRKGIIWARERQMVVTLAIDGGDFPTKFDTAGTDNVTLRFERDETDPEWLRHIVAHLRTLGTELLLRGNATQHETAREWINMADSWQREADCREQAETATIKAKQLRAAGKHQQAKAQDFEAESSRARAEEERARREAEMRMHNQRLQFRERIRQMNFRAGTMRREGRFAEAEELDREIQNMLRDEDPDLLRANELKQRAAQAKLDGKHEDAALFDEQAEKLLQQVKSRYKDVEATEVNPEHR